MDLKSADVKICLSVDLLHLLKNHLHLENVWVPEVA